MGTTSLGECTPLCLGYVDVDAPRGACPALEAVDLLVALHHLPGIMGSWLVVGLGHQASALPLVPIGGHGPLTTHFLGASASEVWPGGSATMGEAGPVCYPVQFMANFIR